MNPGYIYVLSENFVERSVNLLAKRFAGEDMQDILPGATLEHPHDWSIAAITILNKEELTNLWPIILRTRKDREIVDMITLEIKYMPFDTQRLLSMAKSVVTNNDVSWQKEVYRNSTRIIVKALAEKLVPGSNQWVIYPKFILLLTAILVPDDWIQTLQKISLMEDGHRNTLQSNFAADAEYFNSDQDRARLYIDTIRNCYSCKIAFEIPLFQNLPNTHLRQR